MGRRLFAGSPARQGVDTQAIAELVREHAGAVRSWTPACPRTDAEAAALELAHAWDELDALLTNGADLPRLWGQFWTWDEDGTA